MHRKIGMYYLAAASLLWGVTVSGMSDEGVPASAASKPIGAAEFSGDFTQGLTVSKNAIVRTDGTFREITYQIDRLESRLRRQPGHFESADELIRDLRRKHGEARDAMETLAHSPHETRAKAQADFDKKMASLLDALGDARSENLSEKEAYRWNIELKLRQSKDKLDDLAERTLEIPRSAERDNLENSVKSAEEKRQYAKTKLKEIDEAEPELWMDLKTDLESLIDDLESSYLDARSQAERLENGE